MVDKYIPSVSTRAQYTNEIVAANRQIRVQVKPREIEPEKTRFEIVGTRIQNILT